MSILDELSSSLGQKTQEANSKAALRCIQAPALLEEIAAGLGSKDAKVAGDCAEVMTKVAESSPALVVPHASLVFSKIEHRNGRVRWEAAHAFALVAEEVPELVEKGLSLLTRVLKEGDGVIVRDYAADAVVSYAKTSEHAFDLALPVLKEAATGWNHKHAARVFSGLVLVAKALPTRADQAKSLAKGFENHEKAGIKKAARALLKA
jgi:hypothetical protein